MPTTSFKDCDATKYWRSSRNMIFVNVWNEPVDYSSNKEKKNYQLCSFKVFIFLLKPIKIKVRKAYTQTIRLRALRWPALTFATSVLAFGSRQSHAFQMHTLRLACHCYKMKFVCAFCRYSELYGVFLQPLIGRVALPVAKFKCIYLTATYSIGI